MIVFLESSSEAILSHFGAKRDPKGAPGVHFWGHFSSFLGSRAKVKIELSPARELSFCGLKGSVLLYFVTLFGRGVSRPSLEAFHSNFLRIWVNLGSHLELILESFLVHFFKCFFCSFSGAPGRPTTTYFGSPGGLKELLS